MKPKRLAIYARVSTDKQDAESQLPRLRAWATQAGFEVVLEEVETASGRLHRRPGMDAIMRAARGHHIHAVAVVKLDRWGRSIQNLVTTVGELLEAHIAFYAIDQGIRLDKADPTAMLQFHIMSAMAEFEAALISARTREGIAAKRAAGTLKGPIGGRPVPCHDCGELSRKKRVVRRAGKRVRICADGYGCHTNGMRDDQESEAPILGGSTLVPSKDGGRA